MFLEHEKVQRLVSLELIRDINNGVRPEWLNVMIAAIPLKWFAAYIADIATDSSISLNSRSKR